MRYRIEISQTRRGFARISFPSRTLALEATQHVGPVWLVGVIDQAGAPEGSVTVRAQGASDAVWRVAQAAVRAMAQLTGSPIEDQIKSDPDNYLSNLA